MSTVLFLPYPSLSGTWGSVVKLAAIAEEFRRRGDRVVFHACPPTDALLARRGYEVLSCPGAVPRSGSRAIEDLYDACAALGFDDLEFWKTVLRSESEAVRAVTPDVIVSHMRFSAPITARRWGIPLTSCASWCTDPRSQARGDHPQDAMATRLTRGCGLDPASAVELVSWHADLQLATSYPLFEPELGGAPRTVYTGYLRDPAGPVEPWRRPLPKRLVLAYASSAPWGTDRVLGAMGRAAREAGVTLWCVVRANGPVRRSDGAELFAYLPFEQLLGHAAGLILHGGQGSALAALRYGVPSLAIPGRHYERRYNSERIAALGAGLHGQLTDLLTGRLTTILTRMLADGRMAENARRAGTSTPDLRGAATAVDAIREVVMV